jgi:hypothetical protein
MPLTELSALSPLDGRYASKTDALRPILSEAGFMHHRVKVEIAWLLALSEAGLDELKPFSAESKAVLQNIAAEFTEQDAARIKAIEATTNHDVKAVEYWLKASPSTPRVGRCIGVHSLRLHLGRHQQYLSRHDAENSTRCGIAAGTDQAHRTLERARASTR